MSDLKITGKLIEKYDTQQVSERFKKREFVIETSEDINGNIYYNYAKFQLVQNKCEILDRHNVGDMIEINFNVKGNRWEKDGKTQYITNLDAWKIWGLNGQSSNPQMASSNAQPMPNYNAASGGAVDDLPF
jgi:hypothetical protein